MSERKTTTDHATEARNAAGAAGAPQDEAPTRSERSKHAFVFSVGWRVPAGLAFLALLAVAGGYARFRATSEVLRGVIVAGADLGGKSAESAEKVLLAREQQLGQSGLEVRVGDGVFRERVADLGLQADTRATLADALRVGRSPRLGRDFVAYVASAWRTVRLPLRGALSPASVEARLALLESRAVQTPPASATVDIASDPPQLVAPRAGDRIARAAARRLLTEAVLSGELTPVRLPIEHVIPEVDAASAAAAVDRARALTRAPLRLSRDHFALELDRARLRQLLRQRLEGGRIEIIIDPLAVEPLLADARQKLEAPARDAAFSVSATDQVQIVPAEPGVRITTADVVEALWAAATSASREVELPVVREPLPVRTTEAAERLGIKGLVGSFTTRYACCQPRVTNIQRIAALLDGALVEPNATFSVNAVVGARTLKNGFVPAPSIEDGEMVDTIGGGISQFATTLFNAVFHAGYDIIERQPHSYWFPRYPMGHDATLGYPKPDVVFRNDSSAGALIKAFATETSVTVKVYGDTGGRRVTTSVSERRDIVQPGVEILPNRGLPADEEKVKEAGMVGWSVIASRTVTFPDGTKKEERRKVTYRPKVRRIEVHPCRIPEGEPGHTGEPCPEPEDVEAPPSESAAP